MSNDVARCHRKARCLRCCRGRAAARLLAVVGRASLKHTGRHEARCVRDAREVGGWVYMYRSFSPHADGSKRRGNTSFRAQRCRTMSPLIIMSSMSSERNSCTPARRGEVRLKARRQANGHGVLVLETHAGGGVGLMCVDNAASTPTVRSGVGMLASGSSDIARRRR